MTPAEQQSLHFFSEHDNRMDGRPILWSACDYPTFASLDLLRGYLGSKIVVIRETHANRPGAVDSFCPGVDLEFVFMQLTRLQGVSFGVYSGNSFHIDRRPAIDQTTLWPARWMAIRPDEFGGLKDAGLANCVQIQPDGSMIKDGWIYLLWNHRHAFHALNHVCDIAAQRALRTVPTGA